MSVQNDGSTELEPDDERSGAPTATLSETTLERGAGALPDDPGRPRGRWRHWLQRPRWRQWWREDALWPDPGWVRAQRRGLTVVAAIVALGVTYDAWLATCGFEGCPSTTEIRLYRPTEGGRVLDRGGAEIGQVEAIRRFNVSLGTVPQHVRHAFLAVEDRRFYRHRGVDVRGAVRAALRNLQAFGVREGFSTITMQVARNTFLARRYPYTDRSLERKLIELRIAGLLERTLTKDQILELYLNAIYLGNGTFGVEAASRDLFGRSVEHLTVAEGAVLAALPKGPSAYTPRTNPARARQRRDLVLGLMAREGYITPGEARRARSSALRLAPVDPRRGGFPESYALDAVRQQVDSLLGESALRHGDLVIHTTIDGRAQQVAQRAVTRYASQIQRNGGRRGAAVVEGAFVAIDPRTGGIRALVGGREYRRRGYNRAFAAHRQPGSAFKPFVYAAALRFGFTPVTLVDDEPVEVRQGRGVWTPANYDGIYLGRVPMRTALARSSNAATVRVAQAVGEQNVVRQARENGIRSELRPVPSIALGALEVTPLELVAAYAPFANGGFRVQPHLITRIETTDGTLLWSGEPRPERVMDERDAFQLTSMLRSVVDEGTARSLRSAGVWQPVAGKTGTTNNQADVWFVGYTPTVVAGIWFGYDKPRSLGDRAAGGRYAAPAWAEFYRDGWRDQEEDTDWPVPDGLVMRVVDAETGDLAGEWCPLTREEWFKPGSEPTQLCNEHWEPESYYTGGWLNGIRERISGVLRGVIP
ncbi:MAG TPA: PBP1A family penicillin-binding protein [Gemmatimonadaceae bacterium]|nr:PBP1A family penicillin-binding protein [Gemmatimonadaceae bacterium]